jgi:methylmalonyl-CoA mutase
MQRENNVSVSPFIHSALNVLKLAHPDVIILETSGIGQSGSEVSDFADVSMYVMTPEYGASTVGKNRHVGLCRFGSFK